MEKLNETTTFIAYSKSKADEVINQFKEKHGNFIKDIRLTKKTRKSIDYYVVRIVIEFYKESDFFNDEI